MDPSTKKRKTDDNDSLLIDPSSNPNNLTPEDVRKIIEPFTQEQLLEIIQNAAIRHVDVLDAIRSIADDDQSQRKLFIRGLGYETTTEGLRALFSSYGELAEAIVILDKATNKSKGYGFVTFKHIDGALLALKEPSKKIDGRMTVSQHASTGVSGSANNLPSVDVSMRKIFVGNVPSDMQTDRLLSHFSSYGEIEEGPLGFDKQTGKSRGFALFVYKMAEGARASLVDPIKVIDGHQLVCKLAIDGKKGKPSGTTGVETVGDGHASMPPSSLTSQYGAPPGNLSSYGGFPHHHMHSSLQSSVGAPGMLLMGNQASVPSSLGGALGGYGVGLGGPYGGLGGGLTLGGGYSGLGGTVSSLYRLPHSSVGMPSSGVYPESGHYGLSASATSAIPSQHHQPSGTAPLTRVPAGGMYQNMPPYY